MKNGNLKNTISNKIVCTVALFVIGFISGNSQSADDIELSFQIASPSNSPEYGIATTLNSVCPTITNPQSEEQTNLNSVCTFFLDTTQGTPEAKIEISKELSAKNTSSNNASIARPAFSSGFSGINLRLSALRKGTKSISQNKYTLLPFYVPNRFVKNANSSSNEPGGLFSQRLSAYINLSTASGEYIETNTEAGFDDSSKSVLLGMDYRIGLNSFVGIASNYTSNDLELSDPGSKITASQYQILLYASHMLSENWYLQLSLQGANQNIEMTRAINLVLATPVNEIANADTTGNQLGINLSTGYDKHFGSGYSGAIAASVNYLSSHIDGYSESGAPGFNLNVNEQDITSLNSDVKLALSANYSFSWGLVLPQLSAAWIHEYKQQGDTITASFLTDPNNTPFSFTTQDADPNYFVFGATIQALFTGGRSAFLSVNSIQKLRDRKHLAAMLGYRMEF